MKIFRNTMIALAALTVGLAIASCDDANEYEDTNTAPFSWVDNYNDSLKIAHPETLVNTTWVRGTGLKKDADGKDVQGFIESLRFVREDSVVVAMSQGATEGTWVDDSNTEAVPMYEYSYSSKTGSLEIKKVARDEKGNLTKKNIIVGVAVSGKQEGITAVHYGDIPVQTYLVKQ